MCMGKTAWDGLYDAAKVWQAIGASIARRRGTLPAAGRELHRHDIEAYVRGCVHLRLTSLPFLAWLRARRTRWALRLRVCTSPGPGADENNASADAATPRPLHGKLPHQTQRWILHLVRDDHPW